MMQPAMQEENNQEVIVHQSAKQHQKESHNTISVRVFLDLNRKAC